jgi:hypothetical protein
VHAIVVGVKRGSGSFLKKRTKKLLIIMDLPRGPYTPTDKSFCFFFQKEALSALPARHRDANDVRFASIAAPKRAG